jgi:uncharacterized membrane protein YgcG
MAVACGLLVGACDPTDPELGSYVSLTRGSAQDSDAEQVVLIRAGNGASVGLISSGAISRLNGASVVPFCLPVDGALWTDQVKVSGSATTETLVTAYLFSDPDCPGLGVNSGAGGAATIEKASLRSTSLRLPARGTQGGSGTAGSGGAAGSGAGASGAGGGAGS